MGFKKPLPGLGNDYGRVRDLGTVENLMKINGLEDDELLFLSGFFRRIFMGVSCGRFREGHQNKH